MKGQFLVVTMYAGEPRLCRGPFATLPEANKCARDLCMGETLSAVVAEVKYTLTRTVESDSGAMLQYP